MTQHVCVFEGDDAAPEAVRPTISLLRALDLPLTFHTPDVDPHTDDLLNQTVPDPIQDAINDADTVFFGSGSDVHTPILWHLRRHVGGGMPVNVRPVRYLPGANSRIDDPTGIDYVILRENLEGLYFRAEGDLDDLATALPDVAGAGGRTLHDAAPGKYAIRIASDAHMERFAALACQLALDLTTHTESVRLTCATKSNVLTQTDGLLDHYVETAAREHDEIEYEHLHIDDAAQRIVTNPERFDAIVTPNLPGDILSDASAGTVGGLGLAPSGCYSETASYFEPVHGTAPDIAGQNIINPTATILSAIMMLDYLGHDEAARRLETAVRTVYEDGTHLTPDQGGNATTTDMTDAIHDHL